MKLEIKKIRLDELEGFIESRSLGKLQTIPITPLRAKSYVNNPLSKPNDIVLYLGLIEDTLIAFRTVFAGAINSNTQPIRFGWFSGNWVHPEFRREGFSEQLLREAYNDWDKKLMFTNYAPNSEKLYLKTGLFHQIHQFKGVRAYLLPKTRKLVAIANSNIVLQVLFSFVDVLISVFSFFQLMFFSIKKKKDIRFEEISTPDEQCYTFTNNKRTSLFVREKKELEWIFNFPWISSSNKSSLKSYPFSSYSKSFYYKSVKVFIKNEFKGYFIFSVRNGHLKTLHFNLSNTFESEIAHYLKQFCKKHKIEMLTVYNLGIAHQLISQKFPFLHAKQYGQKIYSSFEINKEEYIIQDGEGDVIFT